METLFNAVLGTVYYILMALVYPLAGAFVGWVVGWFFSETILGIIAQFGIKGVAMWQVGLFLGFVGAFFTNSVTVKTTSKN